MKYPATELVLDAKGAVYHLGLQPEQLASKIILVGDQDRVAKISRFFDTIECCVQHREFVSHTGHFQGKRITVISTGIGTDNIDICIQELDALVNIDLKYRKDKPTKQSLEMVRIGTCGILQAQIPVYSFILSSYALGLDNVAHFYPIEFSNEEQELLHEIKQHIRFPDQITPYLCAADTDLLIRMRSEQIHEGITITSSGFYGPQGRSLRLESKMQNIHLQFGSFQKDNLRIMNFEMESSAIFALGKALGHRCTTLCLGVANRPNETFATDISEKMDELIQYVLSRI